MVLRTQPIQTVEGGRGALVGSWQKYAPPTARVPFSLIASWYHSWFREKHNSVRAVDMTDVRDF